MRRFTLLIVVVLIFSLIIVGCSNEPAAPKEKTNVVIAGLKGPTSIGMIRLIDEKALNDDMFTVDYIVEGAPDALTGKIINGEIQIAAVPTNLASVLYNKTKGKVQFLALNTLGVIYVVGNEDISSLEDLDGNTLYVSGKGATPEYAVNYLLNEKELADKVEVEYSTDHSSLAQMVIAGDVKAAVLPQPFVTQVMMKNPDIKILVDLNEAWDAVAGDKSTLAMGCLIINKEFAENNKDFVAEFLKQYESSVNWVNENPAEAGVLVENNGILPSAKLAEMAIPNCSIVYIDSQDSKNTVNGFLEVLYNFNPSSVGGQLPDEEFYYKQ